jgi:hypothetical protein
MVLFLGQVASMAILAIAQIIIASLLGVSAALSRY